MNDLKKQFPKIPEHIIFKFFLSSHFDAQLCRQKLNNFFQNRRINFLDNEFFFPKEEERHEIPRPQRVRREYRDALLFQDQEPQRNVDRRLKNSVNLPQKKIVMKGITFKIPVLPEQTVKLIGDALSLGTKIDFGKASFYLNIVVKKNAYPEDIVDRLLLASSDSNRSINVMYFKEFHNILLNMFPNLSQKDLMRLYPLPTKRLYTAYNELCNNSNIPPMKTPRKQLTTIVVTDLFIAYDLVKIDNILQIEREKKEAEEREVKEYKEAEKYGGLIECSCCCCDVPFSRCLQCPEGHLFCKNCVTRMIETSISEGRTTVKCLSMGGCEMDIPMSELERAIPEKTLRRLFQTEAMNDVVKSGIEHLVTCSSCGFMVEFLGDGNMRCPVCHKETCSKCGGKEHGEKSCEEAKAKDPDKLIEEKLNDAIIRICPKCNTPFMKEEGCNKMECPRCHTLICYWCRKVISKEIGYEHFWGKPGLCPPDKCPLWVANEQLHVIEVAKAKREAIKNAIEDK
jgi:hypothetical protein